MTAIKLVSSQPYQVEETNSWRVSPCRPHAAVFSGLARVAGMSRTKPEGVLERTFVVLFNRAQASGVTMDYIRKCMLHRLNTTTSI